MRWLFLLMVAVNIAIYVWGVQRDTDTSAILDPRYRNIGEIRLLSTADIESPATEQNIENDEAGESAANPEQQIGGEENSPTITLDASVTDIIQESASPTVGIEEESVESAAPPEADGISTEAMIPPMEPSAEVTDESILAQVEESSTVQKNTIVVQESLCWTLGPIIQRPDALSILEAIEKKVASAGLREETEKSITGYWVVLPPYESASAANDVVKQLKDRDVSDVQRFYKGELQNGVSLGIYNQRFNAEKRKAQIEAKGFFPEVLPRFNEVSRYWVDYRSVSEADVLDDMPKGYRELAATHRECDDQPN